MWRNGEVKVVVEERRGERREGRAAAAWRAPDPSFVSYTLAWVGAQARAQAASLLSLVSRQQMNSSTAHSNTTA